jgi:TRAP-type C4-dicarboxylate transport system permease small subunit
MRINKNKNGLDEMQKGRRNSIGNQMFIFMSYALLLDAGLYGVGIHWIKYPANIMIIITVCMGIYLVRMIAANAYLPPKAQNRKTVIALIIAIAFSIALTITAFNLFGNLSAQSASGDANDNSAIILFIVSAAGLFISLIVTIIKKVNDKSGSDD